jgi:hypothetical protein
MYLRPEQPGDIAAIEGVIIQPCYQAPHCDGTKQLVMEKRRKSTIGCVDYC